MNYEEVGYSDEELKSLVSINPDTLDLEEIIQASLNEEDINIQLKNYNNAERLFPNDWRVMNNIGYIKYMMGDTDGAGKSFAETRFSEDYRTSNNVGAVLYMQNKLSEAKGQFEKANGIQDNAISKNNLGAIAGVNGNRTKSIEKQSHTISFWLIYLPNIMMMLQMP